MSRVVEKVVSRGAEPFELKFSADSTDEVNFNLDDGSYHGEDGYFENKTLYITGIRVATGSDTAVEYVEVDGQFVIHGDSFQGGLTTGDDVIIDGSSGNASLEDIFMSPIPARMYIALKNSAAGATGSTIYLQGWAFGQDSEIAEAE